MSHTTKSGLPKLVKQCSLPLTGSKVVHKIITELGVFEVETSGLVLTEIMEGASLLDIQMKTEADFSIHPNLKRF